ncbi:MAG: dockerin type I domain-containing protein [bacterium]|nr:dockerin type I domain-containing protein [bacterium]
MENTDTHWNFSTKKVIVVAGFLFILISIPLSLTLVKNTQIFKSRALETKTNKQQTSTLDKQLTKEVPATSPLSDLKKQLEESLTPPTATPTPMANLAFGPTLTLKISIEGRPKDKQAAKVFIGIAEGETSTKPKYLLTFTVNFPDLGVFSGLSLAGLNPGSVYTAYIKGPGQVDTASTFTMGPNETHLNNDQSLTLLSGDLNEDNTVNTADYTLAKNLYNTTPSSSNWNERADFNLDKVINNLDLSLILKNFGKIGDSGAWYSPPPSASGSATPSGGPSGGYWLWIP